MNDQVQQSEPYILFEVAGATYGLRSNDVQHMEMLDHVTPVPNSLPFVEGIVFSRGKVVPVINLRVRFGMSRQAHTVRTRLLVIRSGERTVGLVADSAREFRPIPTDAIKPPHEVISGSTGKYLAGIATVGDRMVLLLDPEAVLSFADGVPESAQLVTNS